MDHHEYLDVIINCGIEYRELGGRERLAAMQRWREVFAAPPHAQAWKSKVGLWPIFGHPDTRALAGRRAMEAYNAQQAATFFVFPEDPALPALECRGDELPDFNALQADVYIWPEDLAWTMAFTNQRFTIEPGPYFSRREWAP